MPIGKKNETGIPLTVASASPCGLEKCVDLIRRQILAGAEL
jgi:hypothetical protein